MNIQLNPLVDFLVKNIPEDSAPYVRSQYDKLIAERDTSDVWRQFAIWLLVDPDHGVIRFTKHDSREYRVIKHVARLYDENCKHANVWLKAAWDAADAAVDAAYVAAHAADAAKADAYAAATDAAKAAAYAVDAAKAAAYAARLSFYKHMAEKLLELLQLAPPKENV